MVLDELDTVGIDMTAGELDSTIEWCTRALGFAVEKRIESRDVTHVYLMRRDAHVDAVERGTSHPRGGLSRCR